MADTTPPLPPGFTLDQQDIPPLPEGFQLDNQPSQETKPSFLSRFGRQLGLTGRAMAEGVVDLAAPFANPLAYASQLDNYDPRWDKVIEATGAPHIRAPEQGQAFSSALTSAGVPEPEGGIEKGVNLGGRIVTSAAAGSAGATRAVMERLGLASPQSVTTRPFSPAQRGSIRDTTTTPVLGESNLSTKFSPLTEARQSYTGAGSVPSNTPKANRLFSAQQALGYEVESLPHDEAISILSRNGVRLSNAQRSGNMAYRMVESGSKNQPFTADKQANFIEDQMRDFTRAVMRRVGVNAPRATPTVMDRVSTRLGGVFDEAARAGVDIGDDTSSQIVNVLQDAQNVLTADQFNLLWRNVSRIANALDDGRINGRVYNSVRRSLRELSRRPEIGQSASQLDEILLDALQASNPRMANALETARGQYRSLKVIEGAIDKGLKGYISPQRLANAWATNRNRAASVYGRGGDQELIQLARAAKDIVPDVLPDSGTVPRGLMQAPLRAVITAPAYKGAQSINLAQPGAVSGAARAVTGGRNALVPGSAPMINELSR